MNHHGKARHQLYASSIVVAMTKTSSTEENPSPLPKSDEEEEKSRSDDSKSESCSGRSSLLVSIFPLKPVTKSTERKSGVAVLSPKVSHFAKQAVGSESLRRRMITEHKKRVFTITRKYQEGEGEFLETENVNVGCLEEEETWLNDNEIATKKNEQIVKIDSFEKEIKCLNSYVLNLVAVWEVEANETSCTARTSIF
ncbi:unnamed protein product [Linum trigynum]|uniref:Uncharacterized protein n=1 Tax=Linum trigynum TaxID=586398 RepID=A0AAV2F4B2_9ROSI